MTRRTLLTTTLLSLVSIICLVDNADAQGRRSRGRQRAQNIAQSRGRQMGKAAVKQQVTKKAMQTAQGRAKSVLQNKGQQHVIRRAQQAGLTKSQVVANKDRAKRWAADKVKAAARDRATNFVQQNGKKFAQQKLQQFGREQVRQQFQDRLQQAGRKPLQNLVDQRAQQLLKDRAKDQIKNRVQQQFRRFGAASLRHHVQLQIGLGRHLLPRLQWCRYRPRFCHWWYDYCTPIRYCAPIHCVTFNGYYVTCPPVNSTGTLVAETRWHLGIKGIVLPAKGIGIESVEEGSPAALAGLAPGMIITQVNGIDMVDEQAMADAIARSGGVLEMLVLGQLDGELQTVTVEMQQLVTAQF